MATQATQISHGQPARGANWLWFREFIRWEVAPYPGRVNAVIRMTITATLVMLIVVTFRIPNAFLAGLYAILLARENLAATWRNGRILVLAFAGASLYTLLGMILFRDYPITHFFWVIASLYLVFFVMRTTTNYAAALVFAIPVGIALPLWDRSLPSQFQVEGTLWPVLIIAIGAGVTMGTEAVYRIFDRTDPLITSLDDLLLVVQRLTESFATHQAWPESVSNRILQYQVIGTGRLRLTLQRQGVDPAHRAQRGALISLAGRLMGLAADLERISHTPGDGDTIRLRALSEKLGIIRTELREWGRISPGPRMVEGPPSTGFPMLQEMERTVALITEVFQDQVVDDSQNASGTGWWRALFLPDAFGNPEYRRFAFAGCLAASTCYFLYNALDWPGIGTTAVLTCIVTALSTIGNSLQAQSLRLAGFVLGGLVMGLSAQILNGHRDRGVVCHLQSAAVVFGRADGTCLLLRQPAGLPHRDRSHDRARQGGRSPIGHSCHGLCLRSLRDEKRCGANEKAAGAKRPHACTVRGYSAHAARSHCQFADPSAPQPDQ